MANALQPIDAGGVITRHDRPSEASKDITNWFTTETLVLDFGDDDGRPSEHFMLKREYLVQFIQNGWTPKGESSVTADGDWTRDIISKSSETTRSSNSSTVSGNTTSSSSNATTSDESERKEDGDPYWWVSQRITLQRRRLQPENVLGDIIKTYVTQYNAGIANGDGRFNEVVQLYTIMLNHTETEANAIVEKAKELDVQGLFDRYLSSSYFPSVLSTWNEATYATREFREAAWGGAETETRIKFENLIAKTRSQMIGQGTYNGTVWPTVEAGIRRQMQEAIAAIKAEAGEKVSTSYANLMAKKGDILAQIVQAQSNIIEANDKRGVTVVELRNTVLKGMLDFIGVREDVYPQLHDIAQAAANLGFSVGATGNAV